MRKGELKVEVYNNGIIIHTGEGTARGQANLPEGKTIHDLKDKDLEEFVRLASEDYVKNRIEKEKIDAMARDLESRVYKMLNPRKKSAHTKESPDTGQDPKDRSKEIVKALLAGGLVYAPRNSGKTRALSQILVSDASAVVCYENEGQGRQLALYLTELGWSKELIKERVLRSAKILKNPDLILNKKVYVEEYGLNTYKGDFHAATASFPNITVIK